MSRTRQATALVLGVMLSGMPEAAGGTDVPVSVAEHPIWRDDGMLEGSNLAVVAGRVRSGEAERVASVLDFLDEARSPVADGDHEAALTALLELPRRTLRKLSSCVEALGPAALEARRADDTEALVQLQTRISVVTSELAGRRQELRTRSTRRAAVRDLRRLCELARTSLWERHELNWRLRGPMRLGTEQGDRVVRRYYRRNDTSRLHFDAAERSRYVRVLSRIEGGGFDAINAYDWGGVSLGIAQFSASGPYLGQLLHRVRDDGPKRFDRHVGRRGLTVDPDGRLLLDSRPLIRAIPEMTEQNEFHPVLLAFEDLLSDAKLRRRLFRHQVELTDDLIDRAMSLETDDGQRLSDLLATARGRAHLADAFVNTGPDDTLEAFATARRREGAEAPGLVDRFVDARREFYRDTDQAYQIRRIDAIEERFGDD